MPCVLCADFWAFCYRNVKIVVLDILPRQAQTGFELGPSSPELMSSACRYCQTSHLWQNSVHVVVEWPESKTVFRIDIDLDWFHFVQFFWQPYMTHPFLSASHILGHSNMYSVALEVSFSWSSLWSTLQLSKEQWFSSFFLQYIYSIMMPS